MRPMPARRRSGGSGTQRTRKSEKSDRNAAEGLQWQTGGAERFAIPGDDAFVVNNRTVEA